MHTELEGLPQVAALKHDMQPIPEHHHQLDSSAKVLVHVLTTFLHSFRQLWRDPTMVVWHFVILIAVDTRATAGTTA